LERISEWPFNAFALDRATGGGHLKFSFNPTFQT